MFLSCSLFYYLHYCTIRAILLLPDLDLAKDAVSKPRQFSSHDEPCNAGAQNEVGCKHHQKCASQMTVSLRVQTEAASLPTPPSLTRSRTSSRFVRYQRWMIFFTLRRRQRRGEGREQGIARQHLHKEPEVSQFSSKRGGKGVGGAVGADKSCLCFPPQPFAFSCYTGTHLLMGPKGAHET